MADRSRSLTYACIVVLVVLSAGSALPTYAAKATPDSKKAIQHKSTVPSMTPATTPVITKPLIQKSPVPLQKKIPAQLAPGIKPVVKPAASPSPAPEPATVDDEPARRTSGEAPPGSMPDPSYQQPGYDYGQGYDQQYGGEGYYNGGEGYYYEPGYYYYPDSDYDDYQQPEYVEPAPQPFRGVGGSLLEQQRFEFKPLAEEPAAKQKVNAKQIPYEPGQVLVITENMDVARQLQQAVASAGYRPKSRTMLSQLGLVLTTFRVPANMAVPDAVSRFQQAFPDFLVSANTRYRQLSDRGKNTDYAISQIQWDRSYIKCARNIRIGLLDGIVDTAHDRLKGSNISTSTVLPAGLNGAKSAHATALASLLVGREVGLLPGAELHAVNVFRITDGRAETTTAWVLMAIDSLLEKNVSVINLSLGGNRDAILENVTSKILQEKQLLLVAAAGNSGPAGSPEYPAAYPAVIAVTAVDRNRKIYPQANRGDYIDVAAPGVDIRPFGSDDNHSYTGTSFASVYVTAAVALLRGSQPSLNAAQVKSGLLKNAVDLGKKGKDPVFGYGLLNARNLCQ